VRPACRRISFAPLLACVALLVQPVLARAELKPDVPTPGLARAELKPGVLPLVDPPPEPPIGWAVFAGTATALVPLAIGGAFFADGPDSDRRKGASIGIVSGLALAPIISHLVVREWSRAAIFGVIPVACAIGTATLLELQPTATVYGTRDGRLAFGLLVSFATLSSAVGVLDSLGARGRAAERRAKRIAVLPLPFVTPGGGGLTLGGSFK